MKRFLALALVSEPTVLALVCAAAFGLGALLGSYLSRCLPEEDWDDDYVWEPTPDLGHDENGKGEFYDHASPM